MWTHPIMKIVDGMLVALPSPSNLSYAWNFGSLLGLCLGLQIITGVCISTHYCGDTSLAFDSVSHLSRDVNYGWLLRMVHANGASMFFLILYMHVGRGMYFSSYFMGLTWSVGVVILLLVMATAFLGYVLPWGQMSFWGATVITSLFSAIPMVGLDVVTWLWGGFAVDSATLSRFYSFHFLFPFIIAALVIVHLIFLHESGSGNPLGVSSDYDKVSFHPYFLIKDGLGYVVWLMALILLCCWAPWGLGDPENFIPANPLVTPVHIQPEWYFLFAYAILRAIPNKLGGVVALALAVLIWLILPFVTPSKFLSGKFAPILKINLAILLVTVLLLTWIGARPVEDPYIEIGQGLAAVYFGYYILLGKITRISNNMF